MFWDAASDILEFGADGLHLWGGSVLVLALGLGGLFAGVICLLLCFLVWFGPTTTGSVIGGVPLPSFLPAGSYPQGSLTGLFPLRFLAPAGGASASFLFLRDSLAFSK